MSKVEIVPVIPESYWHIDKQFDGAYLNCRWHRRGEFETKFPVVMKIKIDAALRATMGDEEYVNYIINILNEPPPLPKYSGRGRRPKQRPPLWGNLELIQHKVINKKDIKFLELIMYTNQHKNKRFINYGSVQQGGVRPDGRKNRKKKNEV